MFLRINHVSKDKFWGVSFFPLYFVLIISPFFVLFIVRFKYNSTPMSHWS